MSKKNARHGGKSALTILLAMVFALLLVFPPAVFSNYREWSACVRAQSSYHL